MDKIAERLNDVGHKPWSGAKWYGSSVRNVLPGQTLTSHSGHVYCVLDVATPVLRLQLRGGGSMQSALGVIACAVFL
jgi:hypothetical protein